jgi:hypothetical protein
VYIYDTVQGIYQEIELGMPKIVLKTIISDEKHWFVLSEASNTMIIAEN